MFRERTFPTSEKLYVFLASLFIVILVLTNIIGTKLFLLQIRYITPQDGFVLTAGIVTYPFTFWLTDIVSEIWGKKRADLMVVYGFFASLIMLVILLIAKTLPPAEIWRVGPGFAEFFNPALWIYDGSGKISGVHYSASQAAFAFTFDAPGTLLFASMLAYLTAQLTDNYLFHFWRRLTNEKHLWLRNNGSTIFSQLIDTIIVNSVFLYFYWGLDAALIIKIILSVYFVKVIFALLDTPLIYASVYMIKRFIKE